MKVEFTSSALLGSNYREKIEEARKFCKNLNWTFGVQMHNTATLKEIQRLVAMDVPLSFHAPIGGDHCTNFASKDPHPAFQSMQKTVTLMRKCRCKLAVFHGFLMVDHPIPAFNKRKAGGKGGFNATVGKAYRADLSYGGSGICTNFLHTKECQQRLKRLSQNLKILSAIYPDLTLCIENDFPIFSSGLLLADQMDSISGNLCLDTAHLWASCVLLSKHYLSQVETAAETGRIKCVHLHASELPLSAQPHELRDGHQPLSIETPPEYDLRQTVLMLRKHGVDHFTLEIPSATVADLEILADWLGSAPPK